MEIPNRQKIETAFAKKFERLSGSQREKLRKIMGDPPDPERVTPRDWADFREETERELLVLFYLIFLASANYHAFGNIQGSGPKDSAGERQPVIDNHDAAAVSWATQKAGPTAASYVRTSQGIFQTFRDEHRAAAGEGTPVPKAKVRAVLSSSLGQDRIERLTVTVATASQSAGADLGITQRGGRSQGDKWVTQADQRVCPICGPLHMVNRRTWMSQFPDGPPAHVNCRCTINYVNG